MRVATPNRTAVSFFHTTHTLLHWNRYNCVFFPLFLCFLVSLIRVTHHFFRDFPINSRQSHLKSSQTPGKMHSLRKVLRPQKLRLDQWKELQESQFSGKKKRGSLPSLKKKESDFISEKLFKRQESMSHMQMAVMAWWLDCINVNHDLP